MNAVGTEWVTPGLPSRFTYLIYMHLSFRLPVTTEGHSQGSSYCIAVKTVVSEMSHRM